MNEKKNTKLVLVATNHLAVVVVVVFLTNEEVETMIRTVNFFFHSKTLVVWFENTKKKNCTHTHTHTLMNS